MSAARAKRKKPKKRARPRIEKQEVIKEVPTKSFEKIRLTELRYFDNPHDFVDVRVFRRGWDDDREVLHPTKNGVHMKKADFKRLCQAYFFNLIRKKL